MGLLSAYFTLRKAGLPEPGFLVEAGAEFFIPASALTSGGARFFAEGGADFDDGEGWRILFNGGRILQQGHICRLWTKIKQK